MPVDLALFPDGPYYARPDPDYHPCYDCGREDKECWGYGIAGRDGSIFLDSLSERIAESIAQLLNAEAARQGKQ